MDNKKNLVAGMIPVKQFAVLPINMSTTALSKSLNNSNTLSMNFISRQVRRNIRNPWAQCDFTEWDAVKYSDSFKLMEKLVQDLSLSSSEEHQIIGEMKKCEMNGNEQNIMRF